MKVCRRGHVHNNGDTCPRCHNTARNLRRKQDPERVRSYNATAKRKERGIPEPTTPRPECCELCGRKGLLHVDHDHTTGRFRGWLCFACNTGLGKLGDTIAGIKRALDYLVNRG